MSESAPNSRTSTPSQSSPRMSGPSQHNRKIVLVGETLHSVKTPVEITTSVADEPTPIPEKGKKRSSGALSRHSSEQLGVLLQESRLSTDEPTSTLEKGRKRSSGTSSRRSSGQLGMLLLESRISVDPEERMLLSPADSTRSSRSSLFDGTSTLSGLVFTPSSEQKILEDLKKQITGSGSRIRQLEKEAACIPQLHSQIEELQRERGKLANELLDQQEMVQTLKERVAMLHEQNGQLAKLVQAEKGGSVEVLRMRNTLVASIAQLKRLQEQVNQIPSIQAQLSAAIEENTKLKQKESERNAQFPVKLPEGVEPADYNALYEENVQLKATSQKFAEQTKSLGQQLVTVSTLCDGLKKRIEVFETSRMQTAPLLERIRRIEKEKDDLYQEIVDVKVQQQASIDIDAAHLRRDVAMLQKTNRKLRSKMERVKIEARQQKEQFALKLFEMEAMNVKTHKYELEKQLLEMEQVQLRSELSEQLHSRPQSPDLSEASPTDIEAYMSSSTPESKIQMLKLQQLKIHSEQSRYLLHTLLADREELEKKVSELSSKLEEGGVLEMEQKLEDSRTKLELAREKISILERNLQAAISANTNHATLAISNETLKSELAQIRAEHQRSSELRQAYKEMEEKIQDQESLVKNVQKLKDEKRKAEKKYKESKEKLHSLTKELVNSAQLVKDYQLQSATLHKQLEESQAELGSLRQLHASTKAKLEVAEAEKESPLGGAQNHGPSDVTRLVNEVKAPPTEHNGTMSEAELSQLSADLAASKGEVERLTMLSQEMEIRFSQLQASYHDACKERDQLRKFAESQEQASSEAKLQLQKSEAEQVQLSSEIHQLKQEIGKLTETASKIKNEKESLQSDYAIVTERAAVLSEENRMLEASKQKGGEEVRLQSQNIQLLQQKITDLESQVARNHEVEMEWQEKLAVLQSSLDYSKEEASKASSEKEELSKEVKVWMRKVSTLEESLSCKARELESVRHEMETIKQTQDQSKSETEALLKQSEARARKQILKLKSEASATCSEKEQLATELESKVSRLKEMEKVLHQKSEEITTLQQTLEAATQEAAHKLSHMEDSLKESQERVESLEDTLRKFDQSHLQLQSDHRKATEKVENLEVELSAHKSQISDLKQKEEMRVPHTSDLEGKLKQCENELSKACDQQRRQKTELQQLKAKAELLTNEAEGHKATIQNLHRQLDKAEAREIEHEILKQKIHKLEQALSHSSQLKHDNKALLTMLQETLTEIPSFTSEANRSLQEENSRLEREISVLSQWNDQHRHEIEMLERRVEDLDSEKHQLLMDLMAKENFEQENRQLKQELKEVEVEVGTLRRQVRSDLEEELQVKVQTQSQLLTVFSEHNTSLQKQVEDLQSQIRTLGGILEREKPVSPPPMPDMILTMPKEDAFNTDSENSRPRSFSSVHKENESLKERIRKLEVELVKVKQVSASVRRRSSTLLAISSLTIPTVTDDSEIR